MQSLRPQLMHLLESGAPEPDNADLEARPVILLAPNSHLGKMFAAGVAARLPNALAVVDDYSVEPQICGLPRWTTFEFAARAPALGNALALDFSVGHFSAAMFRAMCAQAQVECRDFVAAHGHFGLPSVFETAREYRTNTLARIDDFLALEKRLADDASRETLYGMLLFRLSYDRQRARDIMFGCAEEYFADSLAGKTFILGDREYFVDCGAHQGTIVARFLGACNWKFDGVAAFEPDRKNFKMLQKYCLLPIPNLKLVNKTRSLTSSRRRIPSHSSRQSQAAVAPAKHAAPATGAAACGSPCSLPRLSMRSQISAWTYGSKSARTPRSCIRFRNVSPAAAPRRPCSPPPAASASTRRCSKPRWNCIAPVCRSTSPR